MKRLIRSNLGWLFWLIILSLTVLYPLINSFAKAEDELKEDISPIGSYTFNWDNFWYRFKKIAKWRLQWRNRTEWQKGGSLRIIRNRVNQSIIKIGLNFTSDEAGDYRLIFAIQKVIKKYVNKTGNFQYTLTYDDYSITFDWSDMKDIPQLIFKHGVTDDYFWFLIRRNNIPANRSFLLDPTLIANTTTSTGTYYSNQRKLFNASTRYWSFFSDGGVMRGMSSTDGTTWINTPDNTTGSFNPTANNGSWTNPTYAYSSNNEYASSNTQDQLNDYYNYGFSAVDNSEVEVGIRASQTGSNERLIVDYSTDGGSSFTTDWWIITPPASDPLTPTYKSIGTLTPSQFSDANFRVRVTYDRVGGPGWIYLYWIPSRITTSGIRDADRGYKFSWAYNGTYFHYVYASESVNTPIYYGMVEPLSNGTFDWKAPGQIAVIAGLSYYYYWPNIAVDSEGYPFITFTRFYRSAGQWRYQPRVTWSSTNNGTWTTDTTVTMGADSITKWATGITQLNSSKMYAVYGVATVAPLGRLYNGTSWGSAESIATGYGILIGYSFSIVSIGDDVYYTWFYLEQPSPIDMGILFKKRTYGVGWGSLERPINGSAINPVITKLESGENFYLFWTNGTDDSIYYKKRLLGMWDVTPTLWVTEDNILDLTGYYQEWGNEIALMWTNGTSSPYNVRFGTLTPVAPPVPSTFISFLIRILFLASITFGVLCLAGLFKFKKRG